MRDGRKTIELLHVSSLLIRYQRKALKLKVLIAVAKVTLSRTKNN